MDNPKLKFLEDVSWDSSLKLSNGKTVHGLEQLPIVIKFSDDEVFLTHVTADKNDFANWIREVIGDVELADKLLPIKTKDEFLKFMDQAISEIKNYKAPKPVVQPVQPIVQPVIEAVISQVTPAVAPNVVVPVMAAIVASVPEPVMAPAPSTSLTPLAPIVSAPIIEPTAIVPTSLVTSPAITSEKTSDVIEEIFDFEEIFKALIADLDKEVLEWDAQTS